MQKPFVPRQRKQKQLKRKREEDNLDGDGDPERHSSANSALVNSNAEVIIPLTKEEREAKKQQLLEDAKKRQPKMSSKKKKRLDKYLETKMRHDEAAELIQKLAAAPQLDRNLLQSSKTLGSGGNETKKQKLRRAAQEMRKGINVEENESLLFTEHEIRIPSPPPQSTDITMEDANSPSETSDSEEEETMDAANTSNSQQENVIETKTDQPKQLPPIPVSVGSGLKQPLQFDERGFPILKTVKRSRKPPTTVSIAHTFAGLKDTRGQEGYEESDESEDSDEASSWGGFSDKSIENSSTEDSQDEEEEGSEVSSNDDGETSEDDSEGGSGEDSDDGEEGEDADEDDESSEGTETVPQRKKGTSEKATAFKEWARQQRNLIIHGTTENTTLTDLPKIDKSVLANRARDESPPPAEMVVPEVARKVFAVTVNRPEEVQTARLNLPVVAEEQKIMEAIHTHNCVVLCGETGSGKTTQVPQFLFEAGYGSPGSDTPGMIGVTQPRRVAAVSMAKRVGDELGDMKDRVAYQIRFEATVSDKTAVKFMTDGVLLRELSEDFLLKKYSAIIVDEAHERSINTDILIGILSRILKLREQLHKDDPSIKPLKLIIMSATLRVSDFTENKTLFKIPPPLLKAEARQHPVTIHFNRRTQHDYVEEAYRKVCKIHRRLPPGGVLVFLTGQNEISALLRRLRATFPQHKKHKEHMESDSNAIVKINAAEASIEAEDIELGELQPEDFHEESEVESDGEEEDMGEEQAEFDSTDPLHVLPLYSLLPTKEQLKVFDPPPEGQRLCVLATNVAETSLTIPGIRYVVDCGRAKSRNFDKVTGVQSFDIGWISKASANQRAGRAGRTGPGHCYRLYSSAVFERDFPQFSEAEILRMPIEGVVLQMKSMHIDTIVNFPFPTAPDRESLQKAEKLLSYLGALDSKGELTELGRTMSIFPLSPRFSKILIVGQQHGCLPYVIAVVAALSVGEVFVPEHQIGLSEDSDHDEEGVVPSVQGKIAEDRRAAKRKAYHAAQRQFAALDPTCDAIRLLSVVCAFEYETDQRGFCERNFVRWKAMEETRRLREQITNIVRTNCPGAIGPFEGKLPPPSKLQVKALKQILATGFLDQLALRADLAQPPVQQVLPPASKTPISKTAYLSLFPITDYAVSAEESFIYPHPTSVLDSPGPEIIVYSDLIRSSTGKVRMRPLTSLTKSQVVNLAKSTGLLSYSKPLENYAPVMSEGGKVRECYVYVTIGAGKGRKGWQLGARKVKQRREPSGWEVL